MTKLDIEKFDPTTEQLQLLASNAKKVIVTDFDDREQIALVTETRKQLKAARVNITKKGKELRDDAIKFQKEVIAKEKELIGIIEPEEERLSAIEQQILEAETLKERKLLLPMRRARIEAIGWTDKVTDDELNAMDEKVFDAYSLQLQVEMNTRRAKQLEEERLALEEEKRKAKELADQKEREEKARADERKKIEEEQAEKERARKQKEVEAELKRNAEAEAERVRLADEARAKAQADADKIIADAKAKADAEEAKRKQEQLDKEKEEARLKKIEDDRIAAEKKKEEAELKLREEKEYKDWFASMTSEKGAMFKTEQKEGETHVWKLMGTYKHNK